MSLDLGSALPFLEQRFLRLFNADSESRSITTWLNELQAKASAQSSQIYCVGMNRPVPFHELYQPTRVITPPSPFIGRQTLGVAQSSRSLDSDRIAITVDELLNTDTDAFVFAGPGWGKTTFLHNVYRVSLPNDEVYPCLITLRSPNAVEDLEKFVNMAATLKRTQHACKILLLVDGYDEISFKTRNIVSAQLLSFQASNVGNFYLTCRDYYQIQNLAAPSFYIGSFDEREQLRFVRAFLRAYGSNLNPEMVVKEFASRGFGDFFSHPLLLALACIVRTRAVSVQPRSALRLIEHALDVLCYRWDENKGIDREATHGLDGRDRLRILKRVAHAAAAPHLSRDRTESLAQRELDKLAFDHIDARQVLMETARFYGILVPSDDGWEFVHRTIHDFLAAQYSVESGTFSQNTSYDWNTRTAYAACMIADCSAVIEAALIARQVHTLAEIFSNSPAFDSRRVASAIVHYSSSIKSPNADSTGDLSFPIEGDLSFIGAMSTRFVDFLVEYPVGRSKGKDALTAECLSVLLKRGQRLSEPAFESLTKRFYDAESLIVLGGVVFPLPNLAPQS